MVNHVQHCPHVLCQFHFVNSFFFNINKVFWLKIQNWFYLHKYLFGFKSNRELSPIQIFCRNALQCCCFELFFRNNKKSMSRSIRHRIFHYGKLLVKILYSVYFIFCHIFFVWVLFIGNVESTFCKVNN